IDGNDVAIQWTTVNEFSFAGYELERSVDGRTFYKIGSVAATNTPLVKVYNWLDNSPLGGISFYRLKMIDIDGKIKYSIVIKVDMNARKSLSVYPNPVTGHVMSLQMYGQRKGDYIANLYNIHGGKVMSTRLSHDGNNSVRSINLEAKLPAGIYYLEIINPGMEKTTLKIIIE
ncbi:MAG: T9SS type A sorting domain-containing protein, partial [Chitinophagaceae bacterium]